MSRGLGSTFKFALGGLNTVDLDVDNASAGTVTKTAHGLANGTRIVFPKGSTLPTGLSVDTDYFVVNADTNTLELSASVGGSKIAFGSNLFDVTAYGADETGTNDSTAAITAAADAAGAVATTEAPATVYFPAGTYKVIPPGTMHLRVFEKAAGTWGSAEVGLTDVDGSGVDTYTTSTGYTWHFLQEDPTTQGSDGDKAINHLTGEVFTKAAGTWSGGGIGGIIEYSETLGSADLFDPNDANGANGDFYFQYYLDLTNRESNIDSSSGAVFQLNQSLNNVTWAGAGIDATTIQMRCWGDKAANDYVESGGTITRSAILPSQFYDTSASTDTCRGTLFLIDSDGTEGVTPLTGFHFEDMELNGSSGAYVANQGHSFGNYLNGLTAWDLSHKGIVTSYGGDGDVSDIQMTRIRVTEFRGELVYGGGNPDHDTTITDCEFSVCHASAISTPGPLTMTGCAFNDVYNGFECQINPTASGDQSIVVKNTTITMDNATKGQQNGFVFSNGGANGTTITIGDAAGTAYRDVQVTGARFGMLLNTQCKDLTVQNTLFEDIDVNAIYTFNNLLATYGNFDFDNWTIDKCEFKATSITIDKCIQMNALDFSGSNTAANWIISNCICTENGAAIDAFLDTDGYGGQHDIAITGCTCDGVTDFSQGIGTAPTVTTTTYEPDRVFSSGAVPNWGATCPLLWISRIGADLNEAFTFANNDITNNYPDGWQFEAYYDPTADASYRVQFGPQSWNSLATNKVLDQYDAITFQYNAATNVFDFVSLDELKYAP